MNKTIHFFTISSVLISLLVTSCGPGKKFLASESRVRQLQKDSTEMKQQLSNCAVKVNDLNDEKTALKNENTAVQNDLKALASESKMTIADQAKRLKTFQTMVQSQKDVMTKLKNTIADALMNYKTDELYVYYKDGNVYVSLLDKLLFKSGSDVVDPKGTEALKSLAKVLNGTTDITVMIEGHTDNVPIKTKQFQDNWELSTARATSIVRILTVDNGFDATRVTASGRGKFHPVDTNETIEGRAANRRTEVILSPDLKELYKLIYP
jgi:chemotaxis protein MotB